MKKSTGLVIKHKIFTGLILIILALIMPLSSAGVLALGGEYFYDTNSAGCDLGKRGKGGSDYALQDCANQPGVRLTVGEDTYIPQSIEVLQASIASGAAPPASSSVTIHGLDLCAGDNGPNILDRKYAGYYQNNALSGGTAITHYQVGNQGVDGVNRNNLANCHRPSSDTTKPDDWTFNLGPGDYTQLPGIPGVWVVAITVTHINQPVGIDGIRNGFTISASAGLTIATKAGNGAQCGPLDGKCTTVHTKTDDANDHMTYMFRFGSNCTVPAGGIQTAVSFYDLDYNAADPERVIRETIQDIAPNGAVRWLVDRNGVPSSWQAAKPSYASAIQLPSNNGATSQLRFWAEPYHKYILYVMNVNGGLEMQVGTPYDGAYYVSTCPSPVLNVSAGFQQSGDFEVGDTATAIASVNNGGSSGTADWTRRFWLDNGDDTFGLGDQNISPSPGSGNDTTFNSGLYTFPNWATTIPNPSNFPRICTSLTLSGANPSTTTYVPASGDTGPICRSILRRPYFQVQNGDANAAASLSTAAGCPANTTSPISAFNRGDTPTYTGSGAGVAAFAAGAITEFTSGASPKPKSLSFANTGVGDPTYGGGFSSTYCIPNYWADATDGAGAQTTVTSVSGTVITNGDVYISGNPLQQQINTDALPFGMTNVPMRWIVANNIYIDKDVTYLEGNYIAKGKIYTCATGFGSPVGAAPGSLNDLIAGCDKQLTVKGSFIAGTGVKLQRTANSLRGAPAEIFVYSPDAWIQALRPDNLVPTSVRGTLGKYDSITLLPPVL